MTINTFFSGHWNPLKIHPERIAKADRRLVNDLDCVGIKFFVSKKDHSKIEQKNSICVNAVYYENELIYIVHVSNKKFEKYMDLLLITDENQLHYVYTKDFNKFMSNKTKFN